MYEPIKLLEIPRNLTEFVKMTLQASKNKVMIEGELSMEFNLNQDLRQGMYCPRPVSYTHLDVYKRQVYYLEVGQFIKFKNKFISWLLVFL